MTPFAFALIGFTIISTSFISGLFGMAGGMILVGVLLVYFDVATAMVIFSIIQFVANGWRAVLWWRFVLWRIFFVYVAGAVMSFAIMRYVAIIPSKATVYLGLGHPAVRDRTVARAGAPEHRMARRPVRHRRADHGHPAADRRRRPVPRYLLPEEHARPQDHHRHQGGDADLQPRRARGLFRLVRRHRRRRAALDLSRRRSCSPSPARRSPRRCSSA